MVLKIARNANRSSLGFFRFLHFGSLSNVTEELPLSGVAYWFRACSEVGISREIAKCELKSFAQDTLVGYQKHWRGFSSWGSAEQINYSSFNVNDVCKYLNFKFNEGTKSATLNTIRSALSFFTQNSIISLAKDPNVSRLFRYFYRCRPSFSRYTVTWDVGKVLRFLAKWHPPENLSMRQLTLKTVALIALTSSDRAQTLHVLDIQYLNYVPQGLEFLVPSILKHYRAGRPARRVLCVKWDDPSLNVCNYVEFYLKKTFKFRLKAVNSGKEKPTQFFLSHRTGQPVKRASISRWLRQVLSLSGIDVTTFKAGSTRSASVSAAARFGASAEQILKQGDWSNLGTFNKFYNKTLNDSPVGQLILSSSKSELVLNAFDVKYCLNF